MKSKKKISVNSSLDYLKNNSEDKVGSANDGGILATSRNNNEGDDELTADSRVTRLKTSPRHLSLAEGLTVGATLKRICK